MKTATSKDTEEESTAGPVPGWIRRLSPWSKATFLLTTVLPLTAALVLALPIWAQPPDLLSLQDTEPTEASADPASPTLEEVHAARSVVVEHLRRLGASVSSVGVVSQVVSSADGGNLEGSFLRAAQGVIARLEAQISVLLSLEESRLEAQELRAMAPSAEAERLDPQVDMARLDGILDQRDSAARSVELAESEVQASQRSLADAERKLKATQQDLERWDSGVVDLPSKEGVEAPSSMLGAQWTVREAHEEIVLQGLRLALAESQLEVRLAKSASWKRLATAARQRLQPTEEDLETQLAGLREQAAPLRQRLSELDHQLDRAQDNEAAAADTSLRLLDGEHQQHLETLELLTSMEDLHRLRYGLHGVGPWVGLRTRQVVDRVQSHLDDLERRKRANERQREDASNQLRRAEGLLETTPQSTAEAEQLADNMELLREAVEQAEEHGRRLDRHLTLAERTLQEARGQRLNLRQVVDSVVDRVGAVWSWEIFAVEGRPITLGKILIALLAIWLGAQVAKRLSQSLARLLTERFSVSGGAAYALQNLTYYILVLSFFLLGFQLVGIPLTVLTLLGGVLAIGVGFGSQNVVNNFISGLILLIERPIQSGDLINVDGVLGIVERIGLRSTQVRAGDNTQILVPNSAFLEKNVHNWTGNDDLVRSTVDVGVAYGTPVEAVRDLMLQAMEDEPRVLKSPPTEVLFMEFGDNALLFRGYFWHRARQGLDPLRVQSALRFRIDALFENAGIVIAFPQRDIHLDTLSPLKIEMLTGASKGGAEDSSAG